MKQKNWLFRWIIIMVIICAQISVVSADALENSSHSPTDIKTTLINDEIIQKIITNSSECPYYSLSAGGVICRSDTGIVGVYDRNGKKIFSSKEFRKKAVSPPKQSKTSVL